LLGRIVWSDNYRLERARECASDPLIDAIVTVNRKAATFELEYDNCAAISLRGEPLMVSDKRIQLSKTELFDANLAIRRAERPAFAEPETLLRDTLEARLRTWVLGCVADECGMYAVPEIGADAHAA
jgi:hypothetical protein